MKTKGPFTIKLLKKRFSKFYPRRAAFHQPLISETTKIDSVDTKEELSVYESGEYFYIDIRQINLWGIVELIDS